MISSTAMIDRMQLITMMTATLVGFLEFVNPIFQFISLSIAIVIGLIKIYEFFKTKKNTNEAL